MKRDMDLVRTILLAVEKDGTTPLDWIENFQVEGYDDDLVGYHVWLLAQAGFLDAIDGSTFDGFSYDPRCLTWQGAEFLESIRDPEVWRRTKDASAKIGGAGVEFVWEIAKGIGKQIIKERLGFDIA